MSVTAPSWEEVVNQVTIAGDYAKVSQAAQHWQTAFTRLSELRDSLRDLSRQSESWRGGGGNAFRDHLAALMAALDQTVHEHERIARGMAECARHLETAIRKIPIPSWMYQEVLRKRQDYGASQALDGVQPNEFWTSWVSGLRSNPDSSWVEQTLRAGEEYFANWQDTAQQAYMELRQAYARELAGMPTGTRAAVPGVDESSPWRDMLLGAARAVLDHLLADRRGQTPPGGPGMPPGSATPPSGPGSGLPAPVTPPFMPPGFPGGGGPGGGGFNPGDWGGGGGVPGIDYPGFDYPGTDIPGFNPDGTPRPGTGLESGARFGGGGGVAGSGFGGVSPIGPAVSVPLTADTAGPAAASARGPAGGGGMGMGGMGMMGMGAGAGAGNGDRVGTDTWLKEDEDFFGPDTSAASGVLDG